jgi:hypothetical protein
LGTGAKLAQYPNTVVSEPSGSVTVTVQSLSLEQDVASGTDEYSKQPPPVLEGLPDDELLSVTYEVMCGEFPSWITSPGSMM